VLEVMDRVPHPRDQRQLDGLAAVARQVLAQLELRRALAERATVPDRIQHASDEMSTAFDATLASMARALDLRDREVPGHLERVADITVRLAQSMGVPESELTHMRRGALLHDIGKMGIPDSVLLKPSALTDRGWAVMHQHPTFAYDMLSPIQAMRPALDIPYCHHERWDGQGYPRGLRHAEIPISARIFSVVDVWDALRSDRPYRQGWPEVRVRDYIAKRAGADFDPDVVEHFLKLQI
jgi:response regulator RpfG family c-di-GMP phosphodiesterase